MRKAIPKTYHPKTGVDNAAISRRRRDYVRKHLGINRKATLAAMRRRWRRKLKQQLKHDNRPITEPTDTE